MIQFYILSLCPFENILSLPISSYETYLAGMVENDYFFVGYKPMWVKMPQDWRSLNLVLSNSELSQSPENTFL